MTYERINTDFTNNHLVANYLFLNKLIVRALITNMHTTLTALCAILVHVCYKQYLKTLKVDKF